VGGLATWLLAVPIFYMTGKTGVFGLGYGDLSEALLNGMGWQVAGLLLLAKLLATICAYACGGCGGIFSPTLFMGGMAGFLISGLAGMVLPLTASDRVILAVVGMSSCFGGAVRAPLTAILMLFEMTHQFNMVPALMLGVLMSQIVARALNRRNFYDEVLEQDGHNLVKIIPPRDLHAWHSLPVSQVINPKPVFASDLSAKGLRELMRSYSYKRFPVVIDGTVRGILTRKAAQAALDSGLPPELIKAPYCRSDQTIREIGNAFMESTIGMLVVKHPDGSTAGLLTLHDILRAEASMAEQE
jgi:CIC family chloride channel protein